MVEESLELLELRESMELLELRSSSGEKIPKSADEKRLGVATELYRDATPTAMASSRNCEYREIPDTA